MVNSFFDGFKNNLTLDGAIDTFMDKTSLRIEKCGLKHAPKEYNLPPVEAVAYLCQNLGYVKTGKNTEQIRIPICQDCVNGLNDPDWALIYCVNCHSSQWIYKPKSSHVFHTDVVWLDVCPYCEHVDDI